MDEVEEKKKVEVEELKKKIENLDKALESVSSVVLEHTHSSPVSPECKIVLERGPVCHDGYEAFVGQRKYVLCRAFKALETGEVGSFGEGIRLGWKEVREICKI